jgi:energy-coupling factor transporter ATP-binding protein EcfA2
VYLVTGQSGSGKSTLARALQSSGHYAVSTDGDDYLCTWSDASGNPVTRPDQPSLDWLANCRWVWRCDRLDQIIAAAREHDPPSLWLCGWAANQVDFIDVFDAVFLLDIDEQTMLRRVGNAYPGNDFGRVGDSQRGLIASRTTVQEVWRQRGAIPINATQPLDEVLADLLLAAAAGRLRRTRS